jgi:hypothetical protein
VASEKGKGTQFSFTVHRNPPPEEAAPAAAEPLADTGRQHAAKRRKKNK